MKKVKNSGKALRYNQGKLKWHLMHYKSMESMIRVLEYGSRKYSPDNWMLPMDLKEILSCTQRHLAALMDGEELDFDPNCAGCKSDFCDKHSGQPHSAHVMCNMKFYAYHSSKLNTNK